MPWDSEPAEPPALTLDDFAQWFEQRIGKELGPSPWHEVTPAAVRGFADATQDWQGIHLDAEQAAQGPYGVPVAHGFYTLGLVPYLTSTLFDPSWIEVALNYRLDRVRFLTPVPVGSRVRAMAHVKAVRIRPRGFLEVVLALSLMVEGEEQPACTLDHTRLYRMLPGAALPKDGPVPRVMFPPDDPAPPTPAPARRTPA
ncbi:MaoC family dehydratase [Streptomyces sp. NPDC051243]|uniref:MaoC family dehydratase n=1 Tax=Streptomyces sp. NPDC051243 TaxID=3365646 RepID=UPI003788724A